MRRFARCALLLAAVALVAPAISAQDQTVYKSGDGVTLPVPVKQVKPEYTREGLERRIQGTVLLSSVVKDDGSVGEVEVVQSLDRESGLDQAAIDAMKQWQFKPGVKDGKDVAVRIECEIKFALK